LSVVVRPVASESLSSGWLSRVPGASVRRTLGKPVVVTCAAAGREHGVDEYWVLDPQTLDHRFYRREGDFLTAFGEEEEIIRSTEVPGFFLHREWLDPERLPNVADCLEVIEAAGAV
jgi:hypothetical protein